ncbi:hypothetical protein GOFOIKOB_3640 [Methylobacterium tardum]|jgi:hypothetical protein|nr:hypothetical protein GOFOIKOB_3640 [Methylobacterium tardum]
MSENDVARTNVPATRDEISSMGDLGMPNGYAVPMLKVSPRLQPGLA